MYKQIRIEPTYSTVMVEQAYNFSEELIFAYMEGDNNASFFDESEKSKEVGKDSFLSTWNRITKINFTKVLLENENHIGFDGYDLAIHLEMGKNKTSISLWCSNEMQYVKDGCLESAALMNCVNEILKIGAENGFHILAD